MVNEVPPHEMLLNVTCSSWTVPPYQVQSEWVSPNKLEQIVEEGTFGVVSWSGTLNPILIKVP